MYKNLFPSVEHIHQQSGEFFKELVDTIDELKKEQPRISRWSSSEAVQIANVIRAYTNSNVSVDFTDFDNSYYNQEFWEMLGDEKALKNILIDSTVDYRTGKLKGGFSKFKTRIFLTYSLFGDLLTTEEACAIILHEVGHLITIFDLVGKAYLSNFALRDLSEKYNQNNTIEERRIIITDAVHTLKLKNVDIDELSKLSDTNVVSMALLSTFNTQLESELGCSPYDITSFEFLADQYVSKQNAGRYLLSAESKLQGRQREGQTTFYLLEFFKASVLAGSFLLHPFLTPVIGVFLILTDKPHAKANNYDTVENRLTRIRLQIVARLKDSKLPKDLQKQAREDLKFIDEVIKIGKDRFTIVETIYRKLSPFMRKRIKAETLQLELEKIALNDLYLKAYDLKHIA